MFYTYILYSPNLDKFYRGSTTDIDDRYDRHQSGRERYTKAGAPWTFVWSTPKATRSQAYQLALKLKNLSRVRLIDFCLKYTEGIAGPDELLLLKQLSGC